MPERRLRDAHDLLVLDLDGVLYVGPEAVPHAASALRAAALATAFVTNNASRPPQEVADHLSSLGIPARADQVTTSSQAGAELVRARTREGASVLPVGGPGVRAAVLEAGLVVAARAEDRPEAVLQGFGREVGWRDLCDVAVAVQGGALWVATNTDLTIPTERGTMPGNGSLVGAVRRAVDVEPLVAGKPEPGIFTVAVQRAGGSRPLVVGDRLDTDIAGAVRAGMPSLLVMTGVSGPADVFGAPEALRPTHLGADLRSLAEEHVPLTELARPDGSWAWRRARAEVVDEVVSVTGDAGDPDDPDSTQGLLDQLRAAVAAAWSVPGGLARPDDGVLALFEQVRRRCAVGAAR